MNFTFPVKLVAIVEEKPLAEISTFNGTTPRTSANVVLPILPIARLPKLEAPEIARADAEAAPKLEVPEIARADAEAAPKLEVPEIARADAVSVPGIVILVAFTTAGAIEFFSIK